MMGKSHATSGATVWLLGAAGVHALGFHPSIVGTAAGTLVCAGSALLPDLDHPASRASRSLGFVTTVLSLATASVSRRLYARTATAADRPNGSGHRAMTHTGVATLLAGLVFVGLTQLVAMWVPPVSAAWWVGAPVTVGCLTGVLGDSLTRTGVPLLWPLVIRGRRWYPVGPKLFSTNGPSERFVVFPLLVAGAIAGGVLFVY